MSEKVIYNVQEIEPTSLNVEEPQLSFLGEILTKKIDEEKQGSEFKPRIVSLFSGCGGLDLGFEKAGFDVASGRDGTRCADHSK